MNSGRLLLVDQILAMILDNLVGLLLISLIFWLFRLSTRKTIEKVFLSILLALLGSGIMLVIWIDIGIYFWVKSGDIHSGMVIIPMVLCTLPVFFIVCLVGIYIQLIYRDMLQSIVFSIAREHRDKKQISKS